MKVRIIGSEQSWMRCVCRHHIPREAHGEPAVPPDGAELQGAVVFAAVLPADGALLGREAH